MRLRSFCIGAITLFATSVCVGQDLRPALQPPSDLRYLELSIQTRDTSCVGCTQYALTIHGTGWADLKMEDGAVAEASFRVSNSDVQALVQAFEAAHFFDIPRLDTNVFWNDVTEYTIAYRDQTRTHEVLDINRQSVALDTLKRRILDTVGLQRFMKPSLALYQELVASKQWFPSSPVETALAAAAAADDVASVRFLLAHDAFISDSALIAAAGGDLDHSGDPEVVQLIMDAAGAAITPEILGKMLVEASGSHYRGPGSNTRVMSLLFDHGAKVDFLDRQMRFTPLTLAAVNDHAAATKVLLAHGASVDLKDLQGRTALMEAAAMCREDVVPLLLVAHADTTLVDRRNQTALQLTPDDCGSVRIQLRGRRPLP